MSATATAETVRIASLLDRLDPMHPTCEVPGCQHQHEVRSPREGAPAIAA